MDRCHEFLNARLKKVVSFENKNFGLFFSCAILCACVALTLIYTHGTSLDRTQNP